MPIFGSQPVSIVPYCIAKLLTISVPHFSGCEWLLCLAVFQAFSSLAFLASEWLPCHAAFQAC
jgi:hypothetical protein